MKNFLVILFSYLFFVVWVALNQYLFKTFLGVSYFEWYLQNGSVIAGSAAIFTLVWDVNMNKGLISSFPLTYLGSNASLLEVVYRSMAIGIQGNPGRDTPPSFFTLVLEIIQLVVSMIVDIALLLIPILWLLVVAPIQYFLVFFLGNPGRSFQASTKKLIIRYNNDNLEFKEIYRGEENPDGWWDASFSQKPVTFTYALISLTLTIIKLIVS